MEPSLPEQRIGPLLTARGWWLAVAESCTGGLLGHRITNVPGSSAYFRGGVIAYANQVKRDLLGVPEEVLMAHGAVSRPTVEAMARGVARLLAADVALAISGIAGPGGGTPQKPVGTTWIALYLRGAVEARVFHFTGNRWENKEAAAQAALEWLYEAVKRESDKAGKR